MQKDVETRGSKETSKCERDRGQTVGKRRRQKGKRSREGNEAKSGFNEVR
jgi:hypothetical protein